MTNDEAALDLCDCLKEITQELIAIRQAIAIAGLLAEGGGMPEYDLTNLVDKLAKLAFPS